MGHYTDADRRHDERQAGAKRSSVGRTARRRAGSGRPRAGPAVRRECDPDDRPRPPRRRRAVVHVRPTRCHRRCRSRSRAAARTARADADRRHVQTLSYTDPDLSPTARRRLVLLRGRVVRRAGRPPATRSTSTRSRSSSTPPGPSVTFDGGPATNTRVNADTTYRRTATDSTGRRRPASSSSASTARPGIDVGAAVTTPPYDSDFLDGVLADGTYALRLQATDTLGNISTSAQRNAHPRHPHDRAVHHGADRRRDGASGR